ncbi:hypothetical protein P0F65_14975 [Sphingomonas sp. I4]
MTGGLRIGRSVLTGAAEDSLLQNTPEGLATLASRREVSVLPSASALIDAGPNATMYLRYQQGFRPGGLTIYNGDVQRFNNDHVGTIEAGYRFGRAARDPFAFSFTVAHTGWRNIQADFLDGGGFPRLPMSAMATSGPSRRPPRPDWPAVCGSMPRSPSTTAASTNAHRRTCRSPERRAAPSARRPDWGRYPTSPMSRRAWE